MSIRNDHLKPSRFNKNTPLELKSNQSKEKKTNNFYGALFKFLQKAVRLFYPKYRVQIENETDEPVVYISHHQNTFGPFITLLWFKKCLHTWILHVFLNQEDCHKHYSNFTFSKRFGFNRKAASVLAYPISFLISKLLNSSGGIPVYRGSRKIIQTFKLSMEALAKGESIVIFPDMDYADYSSETKEIYQGFIYLEKYYFKETGHHISFVPLYVSKNKNLIITDYPIRFRDRIPFKEEQKVVCRKIQRSLNTLAIKCGDL